MQQKVLLGLVAVVLAGFSGCGKDDKGSAQGSDRDGATIITGKYRYQVNGCDTGEHFYNSQAQFCQLISNDEINHYCAPEKRRTEFAQNCQSITKSASYTGEPRLVSDPGQLGPSDGIESTDAPGMQFADGKFPRSQNGSGRGSAAQTKFPREVTLLGKLSPNLAVKTSEADGSVITTLEGSFVTSFDADYLIELSFASRVVFVGMPSKCELSVKNFTTLQKGQQPVQFTLVGIDSKAAMGTDQTCAAVLKKFARVGFQARFLGAYLQSSNADIGRAAVNLSVY